MTALPAPYQRQFNFTDWQANHPTDAAPGTALDAEFNALHEAMAQTQSRLQRIQDDDGSLSKAGVLHALVEHLNALEARIAALEARP